MEDVAANLYNCVRSWEGEIVDFVVVSLVNERDSEVHVCLDLLITEIWWHNNIIYVEYDSELTYHLRSGGWVVSRESGGRESSPWAGLAPEESSCLWRGRGRSASNPWWYHHYHDIIIIIIRMIHLSSTRAAPQSSPAAVSLLWWWFHGLEPENVNF